MTESLLSLTLDTFVLVFLGITIYYAIRLSKSLNNFRVDRREMKKLVEVLSQNITQAERAIAGLKQTGQSAGQELQVLVNEAKALSEELQLVNEVGDGLARRLEKLAVQGRAAVRPDVEEAGVSDFEGFDEDSFFTEEEEDFSGFEMAEEPDVPDSPALPSFFIQDREFDEEGDDGGFESRAEKELFQALRNKGQKRAGGGGY